MKARLWIKILVLVELILLAALGTSTLVVIQQVKKHSLAAVQQRSEAIAQETFPEAGEGEKQDAGSADSQMPVRMLDQQIRDILLQAAAVFGLFSLISLFVVSRFTSVFLTTPIQELVRTGQRLAEGKLAHTFPMAEQGDELTMLGATFGKIADYIQNAVTITSKIADGAVPGDAPVCSEHDALGNALHKIIQYRERVVAIAANISKGDLTEMLHARSVDDAFGQALQTLMEAFRDLILPMKTRMEAISSTETMISALAERENTIVRDVHHQIEQMMSTMTDIGTHVEEVANNMDILAASVEETSASVAQKSISISQVASNTRDLTRQTHQTIDFLNDVTTAFQEIVEMTDKSEQLSQETIQDALGGQEAVEQVMTSMTMIQHTITTAVEAISTFSRRSQEIDTILDVIKEITEQTTLLALNASIIAAQAGVHGRGFAVVADEIKNLATGVADSTKDIAAIVYSLQQDIERVVQPIHAGANDVKHGMELTQQAREALQKINASAHQSSLVVAGVTAGLHEVIDSSQEVSTAMEQVNVMTAEITGATREQEASTQQINQAITQINDMSSQIQQATSGQLTGVHQVLDVTHAVIALIDQNLETSRQIALSSEELSSHTAMLLQEVSRFSPISSY